MAKKKKVKIAELADGRELEYVEVDDPPAGGMKKTYFAPDRSYVVQFFHDAEAAHDPQRRERLENIISKYNPTLSNKDGGAVGNSDVAAQYFKKFFCWPTAIVEKPEFGIVAPTYPGNFFFASGPWKGQEKKAKFFSYPKCRKHLPADELGSFARYLQISLVISRAMRRLHQAGLAHSDLSSNNVLIDPTSGRCIIIDIDSLVVPGLYPPDVMGTPGYIAPEVLATQSLPISDPNRKHPSIDTDLHALAVLIYEYLLKRHPLIGPKQHSAVSEEDELLSMGSKALYIEHPTDMSNHPSSLAFPARLLGGNLVELFERAFVEGLHNPKKRPAAMEWERGLLKTWDKLYICGNPKCLQQYILNTQDTKCPYCGMKPANKVPVLHLKTERRPGQWMPDGELAVYPNYQLYKWHIFDNVSSNETTTDNAPVAYCVFHQGQWLLVNQALNSLTSPSGKRVEIGQAVALVHGAQIRLSQSQHGRFIEVEIV